MPRVPLPPFHGGHASQPYPIPTRGAVHEPVGVVPRAPPLSSRGFGAGRGNAGASIGSHLPHQQGTQQPIGNIVSFFNFHASEKPSSQPSVRAQLSPRGFVNNVCTIKLFISIGPHFLLVFHFLIDVIAFLIYRCHFKGQDEVSVMDFPCVACLRYSELVEDKRIHCLTQL